MKNEEKIMQMRVNLMNNRIIGTTGKKMPWKDSEGNEVMIDEPAEIHTYTGWKRKGFQVPRGTKAKIFIPIWNYITLDDGTRTMMERNAPFFTPDQVQAIEENDEFVEMPEFAELPFN